MTKRINLTLSDVISEKLYKMASYEGIDDSDMIRNLINSGYERFSRDHTGYNSPDYHKLRASKIEKRAALEKQMAEIEKMTGDELIAFCYSCGFFTEEEDKAMSSNFGKGHHAIITKTLDSSCLIAGKEDHLMGKVNSFHRWYDRPVGAPDHDGNYADMESVDTLKRRLEKFLKKVNY